MGACCVTGHRKISDDNANYVMDVLHKELLLAIEDGFTRFLSGFARGVDTIFARQVIELQKNYPQIYLEAALPYPAWFRKRSAEDKAVLYHCARICVHGTKYHRYCYFIRNRFMVNTCERVIAVYDGRKTGGTVRTMQYAAMLGRDIRTIII